MHALTRSGFLIALALLSVSEHRLLAHKTHAAGPYRVTLGWGEEPAFTGSRNYVSVVVADSAGAPLKQAAGSLAAEISFGSERVNLPLEPVAGHPGEFRAWLVPTRAGVYSFHITGKINDRAIDVTSTCSETTFHCVTDATDLQFPAKDPSVGQLADRIARFGPRADRAIEVAERARTWSYAALGLGALALLTAAGFGLRKSRPPNL
jgi:hypothetical protein